MKRYIGFKASRYIKEYANEHYPHEACGILFGEDGIITEASGLDNRLSKADSTKHFYMDPTEIFRAEKEARLKGLSILGFFHSHPDAPAVLSKEDEEYRQKARQAVVDLQSGRRGYMALWNQIMEISKTDLKKNYDSLNVSFELWNGESDADPLIVPMIEDMKKKGITRISDCALVVDVKEDSDNKEMPPCILLKSDGAAGYPTTDIATIVQRERDFKPDKIIYVVDKRQGLHFEQVFRTVRKAGIVGADTELIFLGNGTINDKFGHPFKTRDGGVMRLEMLMKDVSDRVYEKMSDREMDHDEMLKISKIVGLAAVKYGDLSNQATKDYNFDIDRFSSFEGNTGPYILYTMVRIRSILEKCGYKIDGGTFADRFSGDFLQALYSGRDVSDTERELMLGLTGFIQALRTASDELAPHKLCTFIYDLSNRFNSFYHENKIISEENGDLKKAWINLILLTYGVLEKVMELLAITVPDKM